MKISTVFTRPAFRPTCPGKRIQIAWKRVGDLLVEDYKYDIQERINSVPCPSVTDIVARALRGDTFAITAMRSQAVYDDVSEIGDAETVFDIATAAARYNASAAAAPAPAAAAPETNINNEVNNNAES